MYKHLTRFTASESPPACQNLVRVIINVYFECPLLRVVGGERKMSSHIAWVVVLALRSLDFICAITNKANMIVKFSDF